MVMLVGCGRVGFDVTTDARAADAMPLPFCDQFPTADLCTDFDDGTTTNWELGGTTNGSYAVENGALRSTTTSIATGEYAEAYINHAFGVSGSRITLALDVVIEQAGQGEPVLAQVRFLGTQNHGIEYVYRAAGSYVEEFRDTMFDAYNIAGPGFSLGETHRIEMDMDLRATPHVIVRHDGTIVIDSDLIGNSTGTMRASVGLVYLRGPSTSWTLRTDNVVLDIE